MGILVRIFIILLLASSADATTYVIRQDGSAASCPCDPSAAGTSLSPAKFKTDYYAGLTANDTVYFSSNGGTIVVDFNLGGKTGTSGSPITFAPYPGDTSVVIDADDQFVFWTWDTIATYITISGPMQFATTNHSSIFANAGLSNSDISGITTPVRMVISGGSGNKIHNNTITAGQISISGTVSLQANNNEIYGNTISNTSATGIYLNTNYGGLTSAAYLNDNSIHDNIVHDTGTGIYIIGATGTLVYNNTVYDNTNAGGEQYGIALSVAPNSIVYGNTAYGNGTDGICNWGSGVAMDSGYYGDSNGVKIYNNFVYGNTRSGIQANTPASGTTIYNNLSYNNGDGIQLGDNATINVYNNTIVGNANGITIKARYNGEYPTGAYDYSCATEFTTGDNITLKNNLLLNNTIGIHTSDITDCANIAAHTNNLYFQAEGNAIDYNTSTYTTANAKTWEASAQNTDPTLAGAGTYATVADFKLLVGSPAINAGVDVGLTRDYDGHYLIGNPDIGAYEYGTTDYAPHKITGGAAHRTSAGSTATWQ
jgi:parallel beta-helix repeat protein